MSLATSFASNSVKACTASPRNKGSASFCRKKVSMSAAKNALTGTDGANSCTKRTAARSNSGEPGNNLATAAARNWNTSRHESFKCDCNRLRRCTGKRAAASLCKAAATFLKNPSANAACVRDLCPATKIACCKSGQPAGHSEPYTAKAQRACAYFSRTKAGTSWRSPPAANVDCVSMSRTMARTFATSGSSTRKRPSSAALVSNWKAKKRAAAGA
mmetsp:Transcript_90785/g.261596  ORF Transcript_90785/g.261596 Transcript_90785/m.261596 type:complete len:216 (-) Transcript_90785:137-784(-)